MPWCAQSATIRSKLQALHAACIHSRPGVKNTGIWPLPTFLGLLASTWAYS
jgi:hypothetical protein